MWRGKGARQTVGVKDGSAESQIPPIPAPLASAVPIAAGNESTISPKRVGRVVRSAARS